MAETRQVKLQLSGDSAWRAYQEQQVDLTADLFFPRRERLVLSPAALVALERFLGAETTFDGPTPAAVLAARAR
jgi:hypothetical protein